MRIAIIGAGNAGRSLAAKLCDLNHEVVMVDSNPETLEEVSQGLDVMTLEGNGADPTIFERENLGRLEMVAAVTPRDEINFLACCWAKAAGTLHTIARLSDEKYVRSPLVDITRMGIDHPLVHKEECAREIYDVLYMPGTLEVTSMLDGKIDAIGLKLPENAPLAGKPLKEFRYHNWFDKVRFIGLVQNGGLVIPDGDSYANPGDDLYVVLPAGESDRFLDWITAGERSNFKKVCIAGAGELGLSLASQLEDTGIKTVLMDKDRQQAELASERLEKCLVLNADTAEAAVLKEVGIDAGTAFVAITGDEEMNIVSCIQAKQLGAGLTVARIDKPEYVPAIGNLNLVDRVVSPNISLVRAILQYVRGEMVQEVGLFHRIEGEILEVVINVVINKDCKREGATISELKLPRGAIVAAVERDSRVLVPTGDFKLKHNDRLAIYCLPEKAAKIQSAF